MVFTYLFPSAADMLFKSININFFADSWVIIALARLCISAPKQPPIFREFFRGTSIRRLSARWPLLQSLSSTSTSQLWDSRAFPSENCHFPARPLSTFGPRYAYRATGSLNDCSSAFVIRSHLNLIKKRNLTLLSYIWCPHERYPEDAWTHTGTESRQCCSCTLLLGSDVERLDEGKKCRQILDCQHIRPIAWRFVGIGMYLHENAGHAYSRSRTGQRGHKFSLTATA